MVRHLVQAPHLLHLLLHLPEPKQMYHQELRRKCNFYFLQFVVNYRFVCRKPDLVPNTSAIVTTPQRTPTNPPVVSTPSSEPHSSHHHHHHHHREKRHSFTSLSTPQHHSSSHRHSAEILSTENETQTPPQAKASPPSDPNNIQLPQAYVALYPYKPQKSDELELRKGGIYIVTERCQDGWFKGTSNRTQKCGVFPGNYVTLARGAPRSPQTSTRSGDSSSDNKSVVSYIRNSKTQHSANSLPPDLPPRSSNPATATNTISSSWHGQQDSAAVPLGRSSSAIMSSIANSSHLPTNCAPVGKTVEKVCFVFVSCFSHSYKMIELCQNFLVTFYFRSFSHS